MRQAQKGEGKKEQLARTLIYVTMSCSHNRLAVRREKESLSVTQHVFSDPSLILERREATQAFRTILALRPPTFQTFVSRPRDSTMPPRRGGNSPRTNFIVGVYPSRIRESSTYVDPVDEFDDIVA